MPYRRLKAGLSVCWPCSTVCLFVTERVLTKSEWNTQDVNVCFSRSFFTFVWFLFFVTWKLLWTRNNQGKTDHPVSLRWNKKFWTLPKRRVFSDCAFDLFVSWFRLLSPGGLTVFVEHIFIFYLFPCKIALYNVAKCQFTYINSYVVVGGSVFTGRNRPLQIVCFVFSIQVMLR